MRVSTKELRMQPGRIIDQAVNGQEVIVTFRGKALARIVPIMEQRSVSGQSDEGIFGMWMDNKGNRNVERFVRGMREGRRF